MSKMAKRTRMVRPLKVSWSKNSPRPFLNSPIVGTPSVPPRLLAVRPVAAGNAMLTGDYATARECLVESIAIMHAAGDIANELWNRNHLGLTHLGEGDLAAAQERFIDPAHSVAVRRLHHLLAH